MKFKMAMKNKAGIIARKNAEGYWVISAIIDGYLVTRRYLYYTKQQAINHFIKNQIKRRTELGYGKNKEEIEEDKFFDENWKESMVRKRKLK